MYNTLQQLLFYKIILTSTINIIIKNAILYFVLHFLFNYEEGVFIIIIVKISILMDNL